MITREPRVFDAQLLAMIRQGTSFFASATMIAIGGCLALLGNTERLMGIAEDLTLEGGPSIVWELKVLVILGFLANAFFKFVWANRLFGYCAVLMGAVPNDPSTIRWLKCAPARRPRSTSPARAASIAACVRSISGWRPAHGLLGAGALIAAVLLTCLMSSSAEFASRSKEILSLPRRKRF